MDIPDMGKPWGHTFDEIFEMTVLLAPLDLFFLFINYMFYSILFYF